MERLAVDKSTANLGWEDVKKKGGKETMRCNSSISDGLSDKRQRQRGWGLRSSWIGPGKKASSELLLLMGKVSAESVG